MTTPLRAVGLTCEGRTDPIGIIPIGGTVRLGWRLDGDGRSRRQTASQIQAATDVRALRAGVLQWDPGRVEGSDMQWVPYGGPRLRARGRIAWRVRVWDERGEVGPWSEPATFDVGLVSDADWGAPWIAPVLSPPTDSDQRPRSTPAPLLRTEVTLSAGVRRARATICGLGFHELRINGVKVGDHVLEPTFTRYDERALATTYDVTELLHAGANAVGVILGRGWFDEAAETPWWFAQAPWRARVRVRLRIDAELEDGSRRIIRTDDDWRATAGPIIEDGVRTGETYDARRELEGWDRPGYDTTGWGATHRVPGPGGRLLAQSLPIRVMDTIDAVAVTSVGPSTHIVDFGRSVSGWVHLTVDGPAGTVITLRHGERLGPDGDLDLTLLTWFHDAERFQRDRYILRGGGPESWEPRFTYHGFRYVRVEGWPGDLRPEMIRARVVHSAFPTSGSFRSSQPLLDAIHVAAGRSFRNNFMGFPTDCPHREKNGWMDAHLHAEVGLYQVDVADGYRSWLDTMFDVQRADGALPAIVPTGGWGYSLPPGDDLAGPAWDSGCIQLPWTLYRFTGDVDILRRHLPMMTRYLAHLERSSEHGIVEGGIGDWCPPGGIENFRTPCALTSTAFYHANALVMARVLRMLGRPRAADRTEALAGRIHAAFNRRFLDVATGWYEGHEMTAQAAALINGLVPDEHRGRVVARLLDAVAAADEHPAFGILGARWVLRVLAAEGHADVAYRMATQTTFPSWGHWVVQGATTLWETWEGSYSLDHVMFGDVSAWMAAVLAGIEPDVERPGFARTIIRPHPVTGLDHVASELRTPRGVVRSEWERVPDGLMYMVDIPAGAEGLVHLAAGPAAAVLESDRPPAEWGDVRIVERDASRLVVEVGSGHYRFTVRDPATARASRGA